MDYLSIAAVGLCLSGGRKMLLEALNMSNTQLTSMSNMMLLKAVLVYTVETKFSRIMSALATQALKAFGFGKPSLGNLLMTSAILISAQFRNRTQTANYLVTLAMSNKM